MAYNECAGWPVAYAPDDPIYALYDYEMPVVGTGIVFVAQMNGVLRPSGPIFSERLTTAAHRRAASMLIHMGLISGPTFRFLREALGMTQGDVATLLATTSDMVRAWEEGSVTRDAWITLAEKVVQADNSWMNTYLALQPDLRPRRIRVEVDFVS